MLIKKKKARSHTEDRSLALVLATTAGVLNAMAFGAFGFFPSHMTGNTSQISTEVSGSDFHDLLFLAVLIGAFIVGATTARFIVIGGLKKNLRTIYCLVLLAEGLALTATSIFEAIFYSQKNNGEILVLLGFLMGVHNSTSTQLSNGRVRSTHVTGTLTDAGIALGSFISAIVTHAAYADRRFHQKQLYTHLTTIFSFLSGCIAGFLLFRGFGFLAMIALGIVLILVAVSAIAVTLHRASVRKVA
ncbi:YoaK family protein [Winslowiella iniecta]|uniref:Membrane protein n=1 Tax=Winslowiella iniecta TaxID=1560201 RepID=A0A0L7TEA2_9GAMM|nr:YoaK family protein [Winslowiella iniecta]KOC90532.1 membrane protein [Winslowiella iniecta]KOC93690.1 membrane protein [Winslowiella iniecta]